MSCINCTSIPQLPAGKQIVHINAAHDYILERIIDMLNRDNLNPDIGSLQTTVTTDNFAALISRLGKDADLTTLEKENINILPLAPGQPVTFGEARNAKNLEGWHTLLHADSLIQVLERNSLKVHFQPIIDVNNMRVHGYECLARGMLANGDIMNPGTMFAMAKKTGLLFNLDRQCRETAIRAAAEHGISEHIFINFLPTAIYNPEFCLRDTIRWVEELELDPNRIVFEVVETESVQDMDHLKRILSFYRRSGFLTALDDVGSGYASLNTFALLGPDVLKIDMELVRDVHLTEVKQSVIRALKMIAELAGAKVLAEGIETDAEFSWLKDLGIDYAQGYYFGKPAPVPQRHC